SLRWLLVGFGVFACVFYLLFVRPTVLAKDFVRSLQAGDLSGLRSYDEQANECCRIEWYRDDWLAIGELLPQSWSDLFQFQRRVHVVLCKDVEDKFHTTDTVLPCTVGIAGVTVTDFQQVYNW